MARPFIEVVMYFEKTDDYLIINEKLKTPTQSARSLSSAVAIVNSLNERCYKLGTSARYKVITKPDWEYVDWDRANILIEI